MSLLQTQRKLSFNDFVHKNSLKNKTTLNINIQQVSTSLSTIGVETFLRDGPFSGDAGLVSLHPSKGTHWVVYIDQSSFDSYGMSPLGKLSKYIMAALPTVRFANIKCNGFCLYSEYKIKGLKNFCAAFCLYLIYLIKEVLGLAFEWTVLKFYYQMIP